MTGSIQKKRYFPSLHFVVDEKRNDMKRLQSDTKAYLWLLQRTYSLLDQKVSLRDVAGAEPFFKRKNEEEFMESLHNVSRHVATQLLEIFSDMYDNPSENDVVSSAETIVYKGIDAPIEDHILVTNVASQLNQIPQ